MQPTLLGLTRAQEPVFYAWDRPLLITDALRDGRQTQVADALAASALASGATFVRAGTSSYRSRVFNPGEGTEFENSRYGDAFDVVERLAENRVAFLEQHNRLLDGWREADGPLILFMVMSGFLLTGDLLRRLQLLARVGGHLGVAVITFHSPALTDWSDYLDAPIHQLHIGATVDADGVSFNPSGSAAESSYRVADGATVRFKVEPAVVR